MTNVSTRSQLRAEVVEISGNRCEHPWREFLVTAGPDHKHWGGIKRCPEQMTEMAHIIPRGMGHKGDRDVIGNVMATCTPHARSTDDLSSPEWNHVPGWKVIFKPTPQDTGPSFILTKRQALAHYVNAHRRLQGWAI